MTSASRSSKILTLQRNKKRPQKGTKDTKVFLNFVPFCGWFHLLLLEITLGVLFVFETDVIDEFRVDDDDLIHGYGPRFRVHLGVIDGDLNFHLSEGRAAKTLSDSGGVAHGAAVA